MMVSEKDTKPAIAAYKPIKTISISAVKRLSRECFPGQAVI
jgi:hypothetical protein